MNIIVTITGPSCAGKSTLIKKMMDTGKYTEIVSTTTRPKRVGEVNGSTYHFVSLEEFNKIEMLERIEFNGNFYGGSEEEFRRCFASGLIPTVIVEPNGMKQINYNSQIRDWTVINVFMDCPTALQAERFLLRFAEEYRTVMATGSSSDYTKLMSEYINRMVGIQETEREWMQLSLDGFINDNVFIFPEYTRDNENRVLDMIQKRVTMLG
jgi:guanylate kinase